MRKVKWGILSTARINRRIIPELHTSDRCEAWAVASRNFQHASEYANEWNIPHAYGSYEALLADPEIDIVYISLPNDLHAFWAIQALRAGKHVLCEKPLCLTEVELEAIAQAIEKSDKMVMEAFMYLHHPQTTFFKKLIDDGVLGEVVSLYSEFAATYNRPLDNYRMSPTSGGGALWDIGVYPISFFHYLIPEKVDSVNGHARVKNQIDMSFWGRIDFETGVSGQFFVSFESVYSTKTSILGTMGRLDISHPYNAIAECRAFLSKGDEVIELDLPRGPLYAGEVENMNDIVLYGASPGFTLEESSKVLELILALREEAGL